MGRWADYKLTGWNKVSFGDVVVVERDEQPGIFYVKRISETRGIGTTSAAIYLLSDNVAGTDSRQWGWLDISCVRAKIQFRMKRG